MRNPKGGKGLGEMKLLALGARASGARSELDQNKTPGCVKEMVSPREKEPGREGQTLELLSQRGGSENWMSLGNAGDRKDPPEWSFSVLLK